MNLLYYEIEGFMYVFSFITSLFALLFLVEIIRRTNQLLRRGYLLLFFSIVGFGMLMALNVSSYFQIATIQLLPGLISIISVLFFLIGIWNMREIIKDIADFGQTLVVANKNNYSKNILSLFKQSEKVCYVLFNKDVTKSSDVTNAIQKQASLVITSQDDIHANQVVHVENETPQSLNDVLERTLKEHRFDAVIVDSITGMEQVEAFEIPLLVQQLSETMKKHNVAGYFIADNDKLDFSIIDDISMIIDRVKR